MPGLIGSISAFLKSLSKKEKFLIIEIEPEKASCVLAVLSRDKNLELKKYWEGRNLEALSKQVGFDRMEGTIIVAADASLAFTAVIPVFLQRETDEPLEAIELENLLAQAVGRMFNQCREEGSRELGVDDLDIVLANSRVVSFKIDDHQVLNPLGFRAGKIEAVLELVFTIRPVYENIIRFLKSHRFFFFTQIERAGLVSLEKVNRPPLGLLALNREISPFSVINRAAVGHIIYRGKLSWTLEEFEEALRKEFGVSANIAWKIYDLYLKDMVSGPVKRYLNNLIKPLVGLLFEKIEKSRLKGHVYLSSEAVLPFRLPARGKSFILEKVPLAVLLERLGISADTSKLAFLGDKTFRRLAPFLEFYCDKSDSTINRWLRRHLNWLGSSV